MNAMCVLAARCSGGGDHGRHGVPLRHGAEFFQGAAVIFHFLWRRRRCGGAGASEAGAAALAVVLSQHVLLRAPPRSTPSSTPPAPQAPRGDCAITPRGLFVDASLNMPHRLYTASTPPQSDFSLHLLPLLSSSSSASAPRGAPDVLIYIFFSFPRAPLQFFLVQFSPPISRHFLCFLALSLRFLVFVSRCC